MKKSFLILCAVVLMHSFCFAQQNEAKPDSTQPGIEAANLWMSLITGGKYGESWEISAISDNLSIRNPVSRGVPFKASTIDSVAGCEVAIERAEIAQSTTSTPTSDAFR